MSIFAIADLHLSTGAGIDKSMEVFGKRWRGYTEKIRRNWEASVGADDTVVIPGDISWAMRLEDALSDLEFLNRLPGRKLIGKGNHDFWWTTASKMKAFFAEHGLSSLHILYNNAYLAEGRVLCGTRGWFLDERQQNTVGTPDYARVAQREVVRLRLSLDAAAALCRAETETGRAFSCIFRPSGWISSAGRWWTLCMSTVYRNACSGISTVCTMCRAVLILRASA